MTNSELKDFWSIRKVKIWVVNLDDGKQKKDIKIVRAKTMEKALVTAKNNSVTFSKKKCFGDARLADPITDFNCVKVSVDISRLDTSNCNEKGRVVYLSLLSSKRSHSLS